MNWPYQLDNVRFVAFSGTSQSSVYPDSRGKNVDSFSKRNWRSSVKACGMGTIANSIAGKHNLSQAANNTTKFIVDKNVWGMIKRTTNCIPKLVSITHIFLGLLIPFFCYIIQLVQDIVDVFFLIHLLWSFYSSFAGFPSSSKMLSLGVLSMQAFIIHLYSSIALNIIYTTDTKNLYYWH